MILAHLESGRSKPDRDIGSVNLDFTVPFFLEQNIQRVFDFGSFERGTTADGFDGQQLVPREKLDIGDGHPAS